MFSIRRCNGFNVKFIVDGEEQARAVFKGRVTMLREQLLAAWIPTEKINEIIEQQKYSLPVSR